LLPVTNDIFKQGGYMSDKLVIIGGVAGGATAAARARRLNEHAEIIIFERGPYISFANCGLPYHIGGVIKKRDSLLVATAKMFSRRYRVDVRVNTEVLAIDRSSQTVRAKNLVTGETYDESYESLILSPGAEPIRPPCKGVDAENIFPLRNMTDMDRIKTYVDEHSPKAAVVAGGGFIGLEMAENLFLRGIKTTIIEKINQVMSPLDYDMANLIHSHLKEKSIGLLLGDGICEFEKSNGRLIVRTDKGQAINCDMVILSVGIRPETKLAMDAGLALGKTGAIAVDATMRTSDPHIYATGDAVEINDYITGIRTMTPLAGPANKQGRIAADNVMNRKSVFPGTLGTSIVKIFDLAVGATGLNEKTAAKCGIPYRVSYTHSGSHAGYYPGAETISIKLLFSPRDGAVLGAQAVGKDGVDKRIDVIATAIYAKLTVFDLQNLELAYAPPYGSAKDPVNIAGYVAGNILLNDMEVIYADEVEKLDPDEYILLDLRTNKELQRDPPIQGALNIPIDDLRDRLDELDKDKTYITYCAVGFRSYLAHRILRQKGFKSKNISGGYSTFMGSKTA
jgi:NADPH-dependent 2,4-dienoyl-CoA reductase/sulfur reductase-like enzyme/rhodanese-related sulfurtransferase